MADVNANIGVNIDTSAALAQLKALQRQISQFHSSIAKSSESASIAQRSLQKNLLGSINSIGAFSAELRTVRTSAESFTNSLEKNKFSMREYFRYAGASTKTFGRLFRSEFDTIGKVAEERVKTLQTQYIKMGRNASGAMEAIAIRPTSLNMQDYGTRTAIAAQKQALFNQLMKQGTTNLLNFGKNTQWAGRQLMVGFTIPLSIVGSTATKTFMDMEVQALKFKKVYGDLFTPKAETQAALDNITELGRQFTKYGIAVSQTVGLAAEAAAAGFQGLDLQRQTTEATRLSVLGQVDSQKALETTISLQNAFGMSSDKLADSINFLNAVENQTVVSLDDITTAIPKVAPVIQQLGGDVKDLTFFIAAMKEGGINASEGANALKSGLAALINPTRKASDMLSAFGINATAIVQKNRGDLKATVIEFATALNQLDPLNRAQAIEQMFGKFQFARLSTLFANVAKDGNQAARVLSLANSSVQELSDLSEQELGMTADSSMNKFKKSVEDLKLALVPVGKAFLEAATPIIEFVGGVLEKFGNLSDGTKRLITVLTVGVGAIGPILLMTFGLLANALANGLKTVLLLRQGYLRLTGQSQILGEQTQYLNTEQLEAAAAAHSLDQSHAKLTQQFTAETAALQQLIAAYQSATRAGNSFMLNNPGMMLPPKGGRKLASGIVSVPGPKGAGDIVPAMLSPGEAVIPSDMAKKYAPLIQGMIANNIPGYQEGRNPSSSMGMVFAHGAAGRNLDQQAIQQLASAVSQSVARNLEQATRVKAFTNFGFVAPEKLNKGKMSGTEGGQFFEQNAELATSRIYKSITDLLPSAANDPAVKQDVILFGKNIGKQLSLAGSKAVSDPEFYNAVENALQQTMTQATTQAFKESLPKIQKQITTIGAFGGDINRGDRGQRIGLSRKVQMQGLGYEQGMTSYKSQTLLSQLQKQGFNQGQQSSTPIDRIRAKTAGTGGGANMVAGIRAAQQAKYNKQDAAILEAMGIKSARSAITATEKEAQVASPSRRTRRIGQDIARGLEVGMADRQDDVARAGSNLSNAAVGGTQGGRRVATRPQGAPVPLGAVAANAPMSPEINNKVKEQARNIQQSNQRLTSFNNKIMGGTFALTSLAGMASMAGGNLGKLSGIVFQLSGVAFALSTILNILPAPLKAFLSGIGKLKFGVIAIGLTALAVGVKLLNNAREKERLKIEGLGDAATLTSNKLKTLGGFFGVETGPSPFERLKTQKSEIQVGTKQRSEIEKLRGDEGFKKDFKNDISTLKTATQQQAQLIFESIAIQLKGSGFANEQINNIIKALQLEANKTSVKIDLKNIDLTTEAGQAKLNNNIKALTDSVGVNFNKGMKTTFYRVVEDGKLIAKPFTELGDEAKKSIDFASKSIAANIVGLSAQLESGVIDAKQFSSAFESISNNIRNMPKPQSIALMNTLMKNLPEDLVKSAQGISDVSHQLLLLQGQAAGVAVTSNLIGAMLTLQNKSAESHERVAANNVINDYKDSLKGIQELWKGLNNTTDPFTNLGTPETSSFEKAKDDLIAQQKELKNSRIAYDKLRKAGISANEAFELSKNSTLAAALATSKKSSEVEKLLELVKNLKIEEGKTPLSPEEMFDVVEKSIEAKYRNAIKTGEAAVETAQKTVNNIEKEISGIQDSIEKKQRNIELTFNRPIEALQTESSLLSEQLKDIDRAAEGINDKYDLQEKALTKISEINQEIAEQEKGRLGLADALSRGDIAAAASAAQQLRADAAKNAMGRSSGVLQAAREAEISGLRSATGLTKDQISARQLEIEKQVFALEQQKATATAAIRLEEDQIYTIQKGKLLTAQNAVLAAEEQLTKTKDQLKTDLEIIVQQRQFWEDTKTADDLAKVRAVEYQGEIKKTQDNAQGVLDRILALNRTVTTTHIIKTITQSSAVTVPTTPTKTGGGRMYGGKIKPMNMGGVVPEYFAAGGRMGSDTVPAMLTPGEFVMNRKASKEFGPMLSMLNESKYPSMIGSSYDGQGSSGNMTSISDNSSSVYNYNIGITVPKSNANPNDIARAVMGQIKYIDNQRIRGQR
jgi:TP901 family phage tail tape measure protein